MDVSRRSLARVLIASAAIPAAAQSPADEETLSAHEALLQAEEQIAKVNVPIATEPAVHFKA